MIARLAAGAGTLIGTAVAQAAADKGAPVSVQPTVWHLLGYAFEAGPMIAAVCACTATRFFVIQKDYAKHRWTLDAPISALALMLTAAVVIRLRPDPIFAIVYGIGWGVTGAGIIAVAKKHFDRVLKVLGLADAETPPPTGG